MKILYTIILSLFVIQFSFSQNFYKKIEADSDNQSFFSRSFINLVNNNNSRHSLVSILMKSGTNDNETIGSFGVTGLSYDASPENSGETYMNNFNNGISLRAAATNGKIKFFTGGTNLSNISLIVNESGNVMLGNLNPKTKLHIPNGDVFLEDINSGIIMKSPDGNCWKGLIDNSGTLQFQQMTCP